jgi:diguanylate cyclase (GGDEF)-like protein
MKSAFYFEENEFPDELEFSQAFLNSVNRNLQLQRNFSLLTIALDGFEMLVHTVDQQTSDLILKEFAKVLFGCICEDDQVFRVSNHEFTIVLNDIENFPVFDITQNIQNKISNNFFLSKLNVCCNIGSAQHQSNDNFQRLFSFIISNCASTQALLIAMNAIT